MTEFDGLALSGIDEAGLASIARALAPCARAGGVIYLAGPLGAGKSTFARALLQALGVGSRVKSPTYSLVESYAIGDLAAHHLDLYRIAAAEEVEWLGLRDLAAGKQLWLIEWPERASAAIPAADLTVQLAHAPSGRDMRLVASTSNGLAWVQALGASMGGARASDIGRA